MGIRAPFPPAQHTPRPYQLLNQMPAPLPSTTSYLQRCSWQNERGRVYLTLPSPLPPPLALAVEGRSWSPGQRSRTPRCCCRTGFPRGWQPPNSERHKRTRRVLCRLWKGKPAHPPDVVETADKLISPPVLVAPCTPSVCLLRPLLCCSATAPVPVVHPSPPSPRATPTGLVYALNLCPKPSTLSLPMLPYFNNKSVSLPLEHPLPSPLQTPSLWRFYLHQRSALLPPSPFPS